MFNFTIRLYLLVNFQVPFGEVVRRIGGAHLASVVAELVLLGPVFVQHVVPVEHLETQGAGSRLLKGRKKR